MAYSKCTVWQIWPREERIGSRTRGYILGKIVLSKLSVVEINILQLRRVSGTFKQLLFCSVLTCVTMWMSSAGFSMDFRSYTSHLHVFPFSLHVVHLWSWPVPVKSCYGFFETGQNGKVSIYQTLLKLFVCLLIKLSPERAWMKYF